MTLTQEQLTALSLNNIARKLEKVLDKAQTEDWTVFETLNALLLEERNARLDKSQSQEASKRCFQYMATIDGFGFGFQTSVSKKQMCQLLELTWLENALIIC